MELQFQKTGIPCLKEVLREPKNQEQTQELRLPEAYPDVGRVLGAFGVPGAAGQGVAAEGDRRLRRNYRLGAVCAGGRQRGPQFTDLGPHGIRLGPCRKRNGTGPSG